MNRLDQINQHLDDIILYAQEAKDNARRGDFWALRALLNSIDEESADLFSIVMPRKYWRARPYSVGEIRAAIRGRIDDYVGSGNAPEPEPFRVIGID